MDERSPIRAFLFATLLLLLIFPSAPTAAHHSPGHPNGPPSTAGDNDGDADSSPSTSKSEDDDGDGVPNDVVDDGDNAHPSGKDKSVEHGKSGQKNQGKAESKPDQNGSGPERDEQGTDKPDGPGGADIIDQDGNNGCGNDDDFDDDNEGKCGGKKTAGEDQPPGSPPGSDPPGGPPGAAAPPADPGRPANPGGVGPGGEVATLAGGSGAEPVGNEDSPQALASTGWDVAPTALLALLLLGAGGLLALAGRRRRARGTRW